MTIPSHGERSSPPEKKDISKRQFQAARSSSEKYRHRSIGIDVVIEASASAKHRLQRSRISSLSSRRGRRGCVTPTLKIPSLAGKVRIGVIFGRFSSFLATSSIGIAASAGHRRRSVGKASASQHRHRGVGKASALKPRLRVAWPRARLRDLRP